MLNWIIWNRTVWSFNYVTVTDTEQYLEPFNLVNLYLQIIYI